MNVPAGYEERARALAEAQIRAGFELTWIQIQMLPVTTDCPPEELL